MKYVCAMCGKEEEVTGCLAFPTFKSYGTSFGGSSGSDFIRREGFTSDDKFCPNCYKRLERKHAAQSPGHWTV